MRPISQLVHKLRATLRRRGASPEDAEDLVQEAFLRFESYRQANDVREPEGFVVRTALNLAADTGRRRQRSPISPTPAEDFHFVDLTPGPYEVLRGRERLDRLRAGLATLNPRARRMLLARRIDGLTYAQIAANEGVSISAVEKQIGRTVLFLVDWMDGW